MKKYLTAIVSAVILGILPQFAAGNWKMHPSFGDAVNHVVETPEYVYFTDRVMPASEYIDKMYFLYRYDKEGEEMQNLSMDNILSYNTVQTIQYNPQKKYLIVVYSNSDIDLLYDSGEVVNIPTYMLAQLSTSKKVNGISIDPWNDRVYLATDFGYIALNDKKGEIAESRNYCIPLKSVARVGDYIMAIKDEDVIMAPAADARLNISEYSLYKSFPSALNLFPVSQDKVVLYTRGGTPNLIYGLTIDKKGNISEKELRSTFLYNPQYNSNGITFNTTSAIEEYNSKFEQRRISKHPDDREKYCGSYNLSELWTAVDHKGLRSGKYVGDQWSFTRDFILPNSPAPFYSPSMVMHPTKGLLVLSLGYSVNFGDKFNRSGPMLLSGYSGGRWSQYSPVYFDENLRNIMSGPHGIVVDPDNSSYVYITSKHNGILRWNLDNPEDIIHLSAATDPGADLPGYVEFVGIQEGSYKNTCHFSPPHFDSFGNLWTSYADYSNQNPEKVVLYVWLAADRKNSTSPTNVIFPKRYELPGIRTSNMEEVVPMKYSGHKNILVYAKKVYDDQIVVIDTNGTPADSSDDKVSSIKTFNDQDGNAVDVHYIRAIYEDPLTGYVWIAHQGGVFYFNPADVLDGKKTIYRVKVSRNDGTNLADYLLNEVAVNSITTDNNGRKWFATSGGGIVCTSSDGREIITELNTANSDIPADLVYYIGYNTNSNSLMVSTEQGLAEYFISGYSSGNNDKNDVKAYPNPVRPDYLGYVTIEGITDGGLVKIADSGGNVIKELGRSSGSDVLWDVTNSQFKRVASGVYYILVSPPENASASSIVGKVLVVN